MTNRERAPAARVRFPPPLVFLAGLLLGIALHQWVAPARLSIPPAIRIAIGAIIAAAGVGTVLSARLLFLWTGQNPAPWTPTPELIERGPYRWTRNPMYVGITTFLLGLGLATNVLWISLGGLVALAVVHVIAVRREETYLRTTFGDSYLAYTARVRRYL